ncbi:MAG: ADP-ribosylglycohydrolase family protein [Anaerolineae bacterium]|nr:ADP-ribosylglycohydrolase family protein [Anaerolineae bacterium]
MTDIKARFLGAAFGLAYGDAISFPALFHRFQAGEFPRKRHDFLWRTNTDLDRQRITRLMVPYTHRLPAALLEPSPTDDTEFMLLTLRAILRADGPPTADTFLAVWLEDVLPTAERVRSSFSERAAIENLKHGLRPPATGNDNPLHYEDGAALRAVPIGLYNVGSPEQAAAMAILDAHITQAEDGIYGAQAVAAAVAALAGGASLGEGMAAARRYFPSGSWIAHNDELARACRAEAESPDTLALLLSTRVVNTVYSYGNAAPETIPAALALVEACAGDVQQACLHANLIAKSSDSLPALVGALGGAYQGVGAISPAWRIMLSTCRGLCLPFLAGVDLAEQVELLYARVR